MYGAYITIKHVLYLSEKAYLQAFLKQFCKLSVICFSFPGNFIVIPPLYFCAQYQLAIT